MAFYLSTCCRNPEHTIRIHPLLLSLTEVINASHTNQDISTISENDERALKSIHYTSPSTFLPLEIHFPGQNGQSFLFNRYGNLSPALDPPSTSTTHSPCQPYPTQKAPDHSSPLSTPLFPPTPFLHHCLSIYLSTHLLPPPALHHYLPPY